MRKKRDIKSVVVLLSAFILIIVGGRFLSPAYKAKIATPQAQSSNTDKRVAVDSTRNTNVSSLRVTEPEDSLTSCVDNLKKETAENNIKYDADTILVGFKSDTDYSEAKAILAVYGIGPEDDTSAKENYSSERLITARIRESSEFTTICKLKRDSRIRYAGLNILFELRQ